jgi:excisionase family DNA binding protein
MSTSEIQAYMVAEAAKELGVTPPMVYRWIKDGLLDEMTLAAGRITLVSVKSVQRLKAKREAAVGSA